MIILISKTDFTFRLQSDYSTVFDVSEKNASSSTDNLRTDMKQSITAKDHKKLGAKCAKEIIFGSGYPKHLRFSTTPTIVNIGLTERNSTVQKINFNLKQLQKLSSYKSKLIERAITLKVNFARATTL